MEFVETATISFHKNRGEDVALLTFFSDKKLTKQFGAIVMKPQNLRNLINSLNIVFKEKPTFFKDTFNPGDKIDEKHIGEFNIEKESF